MNPQDEIKRITDRITEEEREIERLSPLAIDLAPKELPPGEINWDEIIVGPNGEKMTRREADTLARSIQRTLRRRRQAGRVQHGRQYSVPKRHAKHRSRRSV